jgi:copper chaperone NosL
VAIALNEEACHQCRMAISQREFAGEVVTVSGTIHYFDDIGCMSRWITDNHPPDSAGLFVTDYDSGAWLDARGAHYVQSNSLPTPMKYGLAAFETPARAEVTAKKLEGQALDWQQILEEGT